MNYIEGDPNHSPNKPKKSYYKRCLIGYDNFGFDKQYLYKAYEDAPDRSDNL